MKLYEVLKCDACGAEFWTKDLPKLNVTLAGITEDVMVGIRWGKGDQFSTYGCDLCPACVRKAALKIISQPGFGK